MMADVRTVIDRSSITLDTPAIFNTMSHKEQGKFFSDGTADR
jgi:hypothetical protein